MKDGIVGGPTDKMVVSLSKKGITMDKKYLSQTFVDGNTPPWKCPSCAEGRLKPAGAFSFHDDAATNQSRHEEWFDAEHAHYVYNALLTCVSCGESVVTLGDGIWDESYTETDREYYRMLTPRFFFPPLKIIEPHVSDDVPDDVFTYLEKAFQVFWCDADACVNRLRTVVEYLLDGLGITKVGAKGERLMLASRIGMLTDPKYAAVKDALDSLRHMGNDGSHGSVGIKRNELLSAFAVVKYCLEQLYPIVPDNSELMKFVSEINQKKGFR
jgi:hypothetical protein